jgi:clan AA aspartic protease
VTAWVDTAFTGELVIPRGTIERLGLRQSAAVMAGLADGTRVVLETYSCIVQWFGHERIVEVVGNDGQFPLLGVGMLRDRRLEIEPDRLDALIGAIVLEELDLLVDCTTQTLRPREADSILTEIE